MVFREGKHRDADVTKYEILGQEIQQLEQLFRALTRVRAQIVVRVMGLAYSTEENGNHA